MQAAAVVNDKLALTGQVTIKSPTGKTATIENVKATMRGGQSAMITASKPASFKLIVPSAFAADPPDSNPLTELTGARSGLGVIYFALAGLNVPNNLTLDLPYDLSAVQLNGRLAVADQTGRDLQWLFNQAAAALESRPANVSVAEPYVAEITRLLRT